MDLEGSDINFSDVVSALKSSTEDVEGSLRDWRFKPLYVGTDQMAKLVVDSLKQEQYGNIESRLFTSRQRAIEYARAELN